jgi:hypothetical protein
MPPQSDEPDSSSGRNLANNMSQHGTATTTNSVDLDASFSLMPNGSSGVPSTPCATTIHMDPEVILQASLEFQHSHAIPLPLPMADSRTSSSRLYPSTESLSQVVDDDEMERNWKAAARSSLKKRATNPTESAAQYTDSDGVYITTEEGVIVRKISLAVEDTPSAKVPHAQAYSQFGQEESKMEESSVPLAARIPESSPAAAAGASLSAKSTKDDDMLAQKRAAYGGHDTMCDLPTRAATHNTQEDEDDMIALKRAAYEGRSTTTSLPVTRMPDQQAHATVVEYDVHPSDTTVDAVEAEFMGQDYGATLNSYESSTPPAAEASQMVGDVQQNEVDFTATTTLGEATEATVIESGPMEKATPEAWSAAPAAEALVLEEGGLESSMVVELDSKPPAIDHTQQPWHEQGTFGVAEPDTQADQQAEATVVDYDVHPSDFSTDAIQAEYVGQDYHAAVGVSDSLENGILAAEASHVTGSTEDAVPVVGNETEEVTEATVIESGPMEKATAEAWSAAPAEEAQVLEETTTAIAPEIVSKPPAVSTSDTWERDGSSGGGFAMAHREAEVVGITEEIHPSEMTENAAQAELIGSDFNCAIAVPSNEQEQLGGSASEGMVEEAEIVVEEEARPMFADTPATPQTPTVEPQEAHATLINEVEFNHLDQGSQVAQHASPVTAILNESCTTADLSSVAQPATTVTILEDSNGENASSAKRDPLAVRAVSAPTSLRSQNQFEDDPIDTPAMLRGALSALVAINEPEWMRAPFLSDDGDDIYPLLPPPVSVTATHANDDATNIQGPVPPSIPSPATPDVTISNTSRSSRASGGSDAIDSQGGGIQGVSGWLHIVLLSAAASNKSFFKFSSNIFRSTNSVMDILFGNGKSGNRRRGPVCDLDSLTGSVLPRTLLPSSVIYSEATKSWVATVNTNQRALETNNVEESSKALRAFSVPTKKQAMALAIAWAPPKMNPFTSNPVCFVCEAQFAVFRRACHCRNCGVCVCNSCTMQWPSKMLPATYHRKRESVVNICKACDWLCSAFRLSLLHGDHDKACALHSTGNINLTTPFANVKGELL